MNIKKLLFSITLSLLFSLQVFAQGAFQFRNESHDFGKFKAGEKTEHTFEFTNTGNQPITISRVQASCGCTVPEWTRTPIMPGQTGKIKAVYNSKGRSGTFNKSLTIYSNAKTPTKIIRIKGDVIGAAAKPKVVYPNQPKMTFASGSYNFGKIQKGQKVVHKFTVTNTGKSDLRYLRSYSRCQCVKIKSIPEVIKPGAKGVLEVSYTPNKLNAQTEYVTITCNDKNKPSQRIILKGTVVESLGGSSIMKENKGTSPF